MEYRMYLMINNSEQMWKFMLFLFLSISFFVFLGHFAGEFQTKELLTLIFLVCQTIVAYFRTTVYTYWVRGVLSEYFTEYYFLSQVKRKRKEHRSLDSILFEDDGELEYFDVLNLLPLSNVRLEFDEKDARNNKFDQRNNSSLKSLEYLNSRIVEERSSTRSNVTDEEKCKETSIKEEEDNSREIHENYSYQKKNSEILSGENLSSEHIKKKLCLQEDSEDDRDFVPCHRNELLDRRSTCSNTNEDRHRLDDELKSCENQEGDQKVEEAEDYKSIWISDNEEQEDMSRRPQVLKVIDNDVTKRRHKSLPAQIDPVIIPDGQKNMKFQINGKKSDDCTNKRNSNEKEDIDRTLNGTEVSKLLHFPQFFIFSYDQTIA